MQNKSINVCNCSRYHVRVSWRNISKVKGMKCVFPVFCEVLVGFSTVPCID